MLKHSPPSGWDTIRVVFVQATHVIRQGRVMIKELRRLAEDAAPLLLSIYVVISVVTLHGSRPL
jgi:hypothetical protein